LRLSFLRRRKCVLRGYLTRNKIVVLNVVLTFSQRIHAWHNKWLVFRRVLDHINKMLGCILPFISYLCFSERFVRSFLLFSFFLAVNVGVVCVVVLVNVKIEIYVHVNVQRLLLGPPHRTSDAEVIGEIVI